MPSSGTTSFDAASTGIVTSVANVHWAGSLLKITILFDLIDPFGFTKDYLANPNGSIQSNPELLLRAYSRALLVVCLDSLILNA